MVGPADWSVGSSHGGVDVEIGTRFGQRDTTEGGVIWEVAQCLDFFHGETSRGRVFLVFGSQHIAVVWERLVGVVR